jgi:hypothetical protein
MIRTGRGCRQGIRGEVAFGRARLAEAAIRCLLERASMKAGA